MASLTSGEIEQFIAELDGLARTGAPLPEGLRMFASRQKSSRQRLFCEQVAAGIAAGKSLEEAARASTVAAPPSLLALLQCMEMSGGGTDILDFAVRHERRHRRHREALVTAAFYPALVVLVCLSIVWLFANFMHPRLVAIFSELGAELPAATQFFVQMGGLLGGHVGTALLLLVGALVLAFFLAAPLRDLLVETIAKLPGLNTLVAVGETAVTMRFVGLMLKGGVPLHVALGAAGLSATLGRTRDALREMSSAAEKGQPSAPLLPGDTPATAAWLYRTAEERGDLPDACLGISEYCENTFERLSVRRLAMFEPLMILAVALFVGTFVIASYLPLFSLPKVVR